MENIKLDLLRSVNPDFVGTTFPDARSPDENMNNRTDVNLTLPSSNSSHNSPKIMVTDINQLTPPPSNSKQTAAMSKGDLEALRTDIVHDIRSELRRELREELRSELQRAMLDAIHVSRESSIHRDSVSSTPPPPPPLPDFAALERHDIYSIASAPLEDGDNSPDEATRQFFAYPPPPASPFLDDTTTYNRHAHWYTQL